MNNNVIKKICFLVLFTFLSVQWMQHAYARKTLNFGYLEFRPFFYTDENGDPKGPIIDKIIKIADRAGYDVTVKGYPMKRLTQYIKEGKLDFTVLLKVVFEKDDILASDRRIVKINLRTYTIGDQPPIIKKEDLSGKKIGIFRGFSYGGWLDYIKDENNVVNYHEVSTHEQLFRILELGRVDYILNYKQPSDSIIKKLKIKNLKYNDITVMPVYLLVSTRTLKGDVAEITKRLNDAYEELVVEGVVLAE